jgi:hypothetical protein
MLEPLMPANIKDITVKVNTNIAFRKEGIYM